MVSRLMPVVVGIAFGAIAVATWHRIDTASNQFSAPAIGAPRDSGAVIAQSSRSLPVAPEIVAIAAGSASPERDELIASILAFAQRDADEALASLVRISDPAGRRATALALLGVIGNDSASLDRIAAALPSEEAIYFRIDAIGLQARQDTDGALTAAMALPGHSQKRLALKRLAPILASKDPYAALASVESLRSENLRDDVRAELLIAWAAVDPDAVFQYLLDADNVPNPQGQVALEAVGAINPERALAAIDLLPATARYGVQKGALEALIKTDSTRALAYVSELPPGFEKERIEDDLLRAYAIADPAAAWALAESGSELTGRQRSALLVNLQQSEPERVLNFIVAELSSSAPERRGEMRAGLSSYLSPLVRDGSPQSVAGTLDRLLELGDGAVDATVERAVTNGWNGWAWSDIDPRSALGWAMGHVEHLDTAVFRNIGRGLAAANRELARQTLYSLPDELRADWVIGVVRTSANYSPADTRDWILSLAPGQYRDAALGEFLRLQSSYGSVDSYLFSSISDPTERSRAALNAASRLVSEGNTVLACQIAEAHILAATLGREFGQQIPSCRLD